MPFGYPHTSFIGYPVPLPCAGHAGLGLRVGTDRDSPAVLDHFDRLSAGDRRMRFCATMGQEALSRHVERIGSQGGVVLLAFDGPLFETGLLRAGPVRAVAELVGDGSDMELGISVDTGLRGNGIGTELVQTAAYLLAPRGVRTIRAYTLPGNRSFLALARRCEGAVNAGTDEVDVTFDVPALRGKYVRRRGTSVFFAGN